LYDIGLLLRLSTSRYYFFKDESGNVVAQYTYDAWGNILSQSGALASSNPYRYSGYR